MTKEDIAQGSIFMVNLDPVIGHEQGRKRPVIVVSIPDFYKLTSEVLVVPITSQFKSFGLTVEINSTKKSNGIHGLALCQHIRSIDIKARTGKMIGKCTGKELNKVIDIIDKSLHI